MSSKISTLFLLTVASIAVSGFAQTTQNNYVIGPKDVLSIVCIEDPALTGKYTVEADGTFTLPYIGAVKAADLTVRQFELALKKSLVDGRSFRNPQISVTVDQYRASYMIIWGEVAKPGPYS